MLLVGAYFVSALFNDSLSPCISCFVSSSLSTGVGAPLVEVFGGVRRGDAVRIQRGLQGGPLPELWINGAYVRETGHKGIGWDTYYVVS